METLKKLLALFAAVSLCCAVTACTELEEDCGDGDICDAGVGAGGEIGEGGADGEGGAVEPEPDYSIVLIRDISTEINGAGTPGSDICGVAVDCGGEAVTSNRVPTYDPGTGGICGQGTDQEPVGECDSGVARNNPNAALDDGMVCEPVDPDPNFDDNRSCYVSLGIDGELGVNFGRDLQGCTITIVEHAGRDTENYEVFICAADANGDPDTDTCLNGDIAAATTDMGGSVSIEIAAAEGEDEGEGEGEGDEG